MQIYWQYLDIALKLMILTVFQYAALTCSKPTSKHVFFFQMKDFAIFTMYKSVVNKFFHKSALLVAYSAVTRLTIQLKFSLFDAQI